MSHQMHAAVLWGLAGGLLSCSGALLSCSESAPAAVTPPSPSSTAAASASALPGAASAGKLVTAPDGARLHISLQAERRRYWLGENILLHYTIDNRGSTPASIGFGGDYRGATRHTRYRLVATGEDGRRVRDPDPTGFNMGGLGGSHVLKPGERYVHSLPLARYAAFETPGRYRIRVAHDLGWGDEGATFVDDDPRFAELTLQLAMPDAAQAAEVVAAMRATPRDDGHSLGQRRAPFADYSTLAHAPYLSILRRLISRDGAVELLPGIAAMPHIAATEALIALAKDPHATPAAKEARRALIGRLPAPPDQQQIVVPQQAARAFLSRRAWHPRFAPEVRRMAHSLIASPDTAAQQDGAAIIRAIGTADDYQAALTALDAALERSEAAGATRHYPHPATAHGALLQVVELLVKRGARVDDKPASPATIAAYLIKWGGAQSRPKAYSRRAAGWMRHRIPYLRELALERTAAPLPAVMQAELPGLLKSGELSLQVHACTAIASLKQPRFASEVMALAAVATDAWLLRAVEHAALSSGVARDRVMALWAKRMAEPAQTMRMFDQLRNLIDNNGGSGFNLVPDEAEAKRLARVWSAFVRQHASRIRGGTVFSLQDPEITPELMPKGVTLSDG